MFHSDETSKHPANTAPSTARTARTEHARRTDVQMLEHLNTPATLQAEEVGAEAEELRLIS